MQEYTIVLKEALANGLRSSLHSARNLPFLARMVGCLPEDGVTQALGVPPTPINVTGEVWPFPQVFKLRNFVLVCGAAKIYTYANAVLSLVYTATAIGCTWSFADFGDFIMGTNGVDIVVRDPATGLWAIDDTCKVPNCICLCEFNGQIIMGGPGESVGAGFTGE